MKSPLRIPLAALLAFAPLGTATAQDPAPVAAQTVKYSSEQLDNLVAAIALYPDAILAQVLVASTFPEQVDLAARYVKANGTKDVDDQSWDVSVRSIAHYPPVLNLMADRPDWTTALGQAYAAQSSDVMQSVQHLRHMASAQGNLVSTPQQNVVVDDDDIRIEPAQPTVVYVPTYDPYAIYYEPIVIRGPYTGFWSFGVGFPIGGWLDYDCDWRGGVVFYDGWRGGGWRARSRPFIAINTVYAHPGPRFIPINHGVFSHAVNYGALGRFNTVHRSVTFDNHPRGVFEGAFSNRGQRDNNAGDRRGPPPVVNRGTEHRESWSRDNNSRGRQDPPRVEQRRPDPRAQGRPGPTSESRISIPDRATRSAPAPIVRHAAPPPATRERSAPPPRSSGASHSPPPSHSAPPSHGSSHGSSSSDRHR